MTFKESAVPEFIDLFQDRKNDIRSFPGCTHLELWQDKHQTNIYFTHSQWVNEDALNHYRYSAFFKETWKLTRQYFATKAEAYSISQIFVEP